MTYSVRRPGCTAWAEGLSLEEAKAEKERANRIAPGHMVYEEEREKGAAQ